MNHSTVDRESENANLENAGIENEEAMIPSGDELENNYSDVDSEDDYGIVEDGYPESADQLNMM